MGCNGSRLQNLESIPARFRPILRRRIEEVRRRRRLVSAKDESTKKELLPADGKPNDVDDRKSRVGKGDGSLVSSSVMEEEEGSKGKEEEGRESKVVADGGHRGSDGGVPDLDDDATDDDDDVVDDSSISFPASPSFRIYFVDNGDNSDHDDDDHHSLETVEEEAVEEKIQNCDSDALPEKEPGTKKVEKKVRKRKSLKKVIPRGGQAAIKNLLNVKACYTPPCGVPRHNRALLLSEKP